MAHLEDADEGLGEAVKVAAPHLCVLEVVPASEELHAQQGEDDNEEEQQQQQGGYGADGVEQGSHQVAQGRPVPEEGEQRDGQEAELSPQRSWGTMGCRGEGLCSPGSRLRAHSPLPARLLFPRWGCGFTSGPSTCLETPRD